MAEYRDLNALFNYLQKQVNSSMEYEVSDEIKEVMQDHIQKDVYDAYEPHPEGLKYIRSYDLLKDVESKLISDGTLMLHDTRKDPEYPNKDIVNIIETGKGYTWGLAGGFVRDLNEQIGPRPFVENTYNDLSMNKQHVETLKKSLINKGLQVE